MPKLSVSTRRFFRRLNPSPSIWRMVGYATVQAMNAWMGTLNYRCVRYTPDADPADPRYVGPAIFVLWHEYIPFPFYTRPRCDLAILLSHHQDAEVLSHVAEFAGLQVVRGSTSRGGTTALRSIMRQGRGLSLAITPDGPRGPRRRLAQGCIYLSSRLQIPIIPVGIGYDRPWRNSKSWDQFAIPRPFSRARSVLGPPIQVPRDLDRDEIELHRRWVEERLNLLSDFSERWAERKIRVADSEPLYPNWPRPRQAQAIQRQNQRQFPLSTTNHQPPTNN